MTVSADARSICADRRSVDWHVDWNVGWDVVGVYTDSLLNILNGLWCYVWSVYWFNSIRVWANSYEVLRDRLRICADALNNCGNCIWVLDFVICSNIIRVSADAIYVWWDSIKALLIQLKTWLIWLFLGSSWW